MFQNGDFLTCGMETRCAATIGFFDGVHRGHRFLLRQLETLAAEKGVMPVCVTFDQHPRQVLCDEFVPSLLTTQEEKLSLLSQTFGGKTIVLPFTKELSRLSAKQFMQTILREKLNTTTLLMGYNHHFGHGSGAREDYILWGKEAGIEVGFADALEGEKVSSSRIRELIAAGDIEHANKMLSYSYFMTGKVVAGKQIGRTMGFPTANLKVAEQKLVPPSGVYAVRATLPDKTEKEGMLSIGRRPTIEKDGETSIEAHLFDYAGNLYGATIFVHFIAKFRDEQPFSSLEDLRRQLTIDAATARSILESER